MAVVTKSRVILASLFLSFFAILSCNTSNYSKKFHQDIDSTLWHMNQKFFAYFEKNKDKDSLRSILNLNTLRYELQSDQYFIQSQRVPKEDSLYWVGAQYLAANYFDCSWNELPSLLECYKSHEDSIQHYQGLILKKEKGAILFYLKYLTNRQYVDKEKWLLYLKKQPKMIFQNTNHEINK